MQSAYAADAAPVGGLDEIVVTAQKRSENLQDVPVAIQAFDTAKLEKLNIVSLDDYVKYAPSVSYVRGQGQGGNGQPGSSHVYMRGVVTGADGNHSGSQPSVGTYLDEQPVTTIDGTVDVHIYDIQRIEVLEGPQGTLYGASSEAGTIRIITNKPDPKEFTAGYDIGVNTVKHGSGVGYEAEGFVNIPLSPIAAIRVVGWDEKDSGFISNVAGTNATGCIQNGVRTFLNWGNPNPSANAGYPVPSPCPATGTVGVNAISNAAYVKSAYNTVETKGGRAALKLDLGDNWSVTPTFMGQKVDTNGFFGYDPAVGDLELVHFGPEYSSDSWYQAALTVNGKVSDFDITYAGGYMKRDTLSLADYSDYSLFYDRVFGSGAYWTNNAGKPIMPQEFVYSRGYFEKWSHELRVSTPKDLPVKATAGAFIQRQLHDIWEQYTMPGYGFTDATAQTPQPNGFGSNYSVPGLNNTIWLTDETRVDRDQALFANLTWDITDHWQLNGGYRYYKYDNSLQGFYGYAGAFAAKGPGQGDPTANPIALGNGKTCYEADGTYRPPTAAYSPCTNLDKDVSGSGSVPRLNATYKFSPDAMVYLTYSKGFRPGGANRTAVAGIGPYQADYLTNYEFGWKTQWLDRRVRWNGSIFWEDWKNFQYSFLGPNSLTIIENGGNARIKGIESDLEFRVTNALTLSSAMTLLQAVTTTNVCSQLGESEAACYKDTYPEPWGFANQGYQYTGPLARKGTDMPVSPKFKGNIVARYSFEDVRGWQPFGQFSAVYQTKTAPVLRADTTQVFGMMPAWALMDLSLGATSHGTQVQLAISNLADRRAELSRFTQSANAGQPYVIPAQPRTISLKFGQKF